MFILVFRPHQRPAWATSYDTDADFVRAFINDNFARSCNAECTSEDRDEMDGQSEDEQYATAFGRVGHDLSSLTRLDSAEEVQRYLNERDYCWHHNKGCVAVEAAAREAGWMDNDDADDEVDAEGTGCGRGDFESEVAE